MTAQPLNTTIGVCFGPAPIKALVPSSKYSHTYTHSLLITEVKSEFEAYLSAPVCVSVRAEPGLQPEPAAAAAAAAAPADSDCPLRCRCRCAASLPTASPSGCLWPRGY